MLRGTLRQFSGMHPLTWVCGCEFGSKGQRLEGRLAQGAFKGFDWRRVNMKGAPLHVFLLILTQQSVYNMILYNKKGFCLYLFEI